MDPISKRINTMLLAAMIACAPAYAAENQPTTIVAQQQDATNGQSSVDWYKKRSTHIMAAFAATVVGIYALAVRKNKIAGPIALFTALFCAHKKIVEVKDAHEMKDDQDKQQEPGIKPQDNENQQPHQDSSSNENKQITSNVEKDKAIDPVVNPEDQKKEPVAEVKKPADDTGDKEQPLPIIKNAEKNTQVTYEAPLHIRVQEYTSNALSGLKNWVVRGLVETEESSKN